LLHPKKVGTLPQEDNEDAKRTNEIKMAVPVLDSIDIRGKVITADALLTQRNLADYLVQRKAHYHFTVKANQSTLLQNIAFFFINRKAPDYINDAPPDHGRIEIRKIWTITELNDYLDFPHVGQAFVVERHCIDRQILL
jgi:predicted transposase YbfD/YdcC